MATTGKVPKFGFGAGAIKYAALQGFSPYPGAAPNPRIPTLGFGANAGARLTLFGFTANPGSGGAGAFYLFGGSIIR